MEQLIALLNTMPEYETLVQALHRGDSAAVTGIGQVNRSHLIAGLRRNLKQPIAVICQDDMAARRLQEELQAFLGETAPILPSRELTLYDSAVVSRAWEQKRLRQLYDLSLGKVPLQIFTWESLSQRTMTKQAGIPLTDAVAMLTVNPAREIGISDRKGKLEVGYDADLVLFDGDINISAVWCRGAKTV